MVLGRGNKNSPAREVRPQDPPLPPPPYNENSYASPIVLAETRTTTSRTEVVTTTSTQTTTHFFSLPLWRRRPATASSSARQSISGVEELGLATDTSSPGALMMDKALPPTPTMSQEAHREALPQMGQMVNGTANVAGPEIVVSSSKSDTPSQRKTTQRGQHGHPPPPTLALAKASLGLGLTNIIHIPQTHSSSSSDVNTVAFATSASPIRPRAGMRRAKSSQKLRITDSDDHVIPLRKSLDLGERMRTRDDSMIGSAAQSSDKGKGKDTADPPVQSLSRRPSFWSRKKKDDIPPPPPPTFPTVPERTPRPSLPSVFPGSPFSMDVGAASSSSPSTSQHRHNSPRSQGLSRSFSEKASPHSPTSPWLLDANTSQSSQNPQRSLPSPRYRPSTADASAHIPPRVSLPRPTTADASPRTDRKSVV